MTLVGASLVCALVALLLLRVFAAEQSIAVVGALLAALYTAIGFFDLARLPRRVGATSHQRW
jgi:uncharacterized protein involved in cysteine biosynthesis